MKSFKKRIFDIIQIGNKEDIPSTAFDLFIVVVIVSNILCMILETFEELNGLQGFFRSIEISTMVVFCIEYALRIWTAEYLYPEKTSGQAKLKFLRSYDGIVDLLTILPFFFLTGFVVLRMLRVVRIFHLFRINSQYDSFKVITNVLYEKRNQIVSSIVIILILMFASSLCMYSAEHDAQPEAFRNAFSGLWWSVSAMLTVGYGDIYPITAMGRVMAVIISFMGVGVVAIPTGIISAGFVEHYQQSLIADHPPVDINRIGEVLVDEQSPYLGMQVADIRANYDMEIYLIMRGNLSVVAAGNVTVEKDDILIVQTRELVKKKA